MGQCSSSVDNIDIPENNELYISGKIPKKGKIIMYFTVELNNKNFVIKSSNTSSDSENGEKPHKNKGVTKIVSRRRNTLKSDLRVDTNYKEDAPITSPKINKSNKNSNQIFNKDSSSDECIIHYKKNTQTNKNGKSSDTNDTNIKSQTNPSFNPIFFSPDVSVEEDICIFCGKQGVSSKICSNISGYGAIWPYCKSCESKAKKSEEIYLKSFGAEFYFKFCDDEIKIYDGKGWIRACKVNFGVPKRTLSDGQVQVSVYWLENKINKSCYVNINDIIEWNK
jgi:hypothetical protein